MLNKIKSYFNKKPKGEFSFSYKKCIGMETAYVEITLINHKYKWKWVKHIDLPIMKSDIVEAEKTLLSWMHEYIESKETDGSKELSEDDIINWARKRQCGSND